MVVLEAHEVQGKVEENSFPGTPEEIPRIVLVGDILGIQSRDPKIVWGARKGDGRTTETGRTGGAQTTGNGRNGGPTENAQTRKSIETRTIILAVLEGTKMTHD